jgi:hypothetical protein
MIHPATAQSAPQTLVGRVSARTYIRAILTALDGAVVPMVVQEAEHGGIARTAAVACGRWCLRPVARGACVPADPSTDCPTTRSTVP